MALSQSYRKLKLQSDQHRDLEARTLAPIFENLWHRRLRHQVNAPEFCALQVLGYLGLRRRNVQWLRRRSSSWTILKNPPSTGAFSDWNLFSSVWSDQVIRSLNGLHLYEVLQEFDLLCIPYGIQRGLLGWLNEPTQMDLSCEVVTPLRMLQVQATGRRIVTSFFAEEDLRKLHQGKEACEFLLHDLEHADKFFHQTQTHQLQTQFFSRLLTAYQDGAFSDRLLQDATFQAQFDYVMADMNSHPAHLEKYFTAICLNSLLRAEGKSERQTLSEIGQKKLNSWRTMFRDDMANCKTSHSMDTILTHQKGNL